MEGLKALDSEMFDFGLTRALLAEDFVQMAILAAILLGLIAGLIGPFVVIRQMSFSVHGTSELALTGAAAALLFGANLGLGSILGAVVAAIIFAAMGARADQRDSSIGVVLSFGLGLAILFIHLYPGRSGTSFALLTGQIVGVTQSGVIQLAVVTAVVVLSISFLYRPLLFSSADSEVAQARGVPTRLINLAFAILLGLVAAQAVQIVGALLVLALLITPAAAAAQVCSSPGAVITLTIIFAEVAAVGGIVLSLSPGIPISVFVATISFCIYLGCRTWAIVRNR